MGIATASTHAGATPITLRLLPAFQKMSEHEFFKFCQLNRELRIERTSEGACLENPETLSGGLVLPGFVLDLRQIGS